MALLAFRFCLRCLFSSDLCERDIRSSTILVAGSAHDQTGMFQLRKHFTCRSRLDSKPFCQDPLRDLTGLKKHNEDPLLTPLSLIERPHRMINIAEIDDQTSRPIRALILFFPQITVHFFLIFLFHRQIPFRISLGTLILTWLYSPCQVKRYATVHFADKLPSAIFVNCYIYSEVRRKKMIASATFFVIYCLTVENIFLESR